MKYILGIDVGGTKIAAGLVDKTYKVRKVKTLATSQNDLLGQLLKLSGSYKGFKGIGLGLPGLIRPNGFVLSLGNIPKFKPVNLKTLFQKRFAVPVSIMNDARAFSLAEATVGEGKGVQTVLGVILGTGIGSGLVKNKKIQSAKGPVGGEIGLVKLGNKTLEQTMKRRGNTAKQLEPIMRAIIMLATRLADPDLIIFGGGRTTYNGMNELVRRLNIKARVSKLKHAGVIGAALPLLKK